MKNTSSNLTLAIDGGSKAIQTPWPPRGLFGKSEKAAVMKLFDRTISTGVDFGYNGAEEEAYCSEFAEWLGGGYADGVNSGTNAVYVALRALDLEPFTEVICPAITDPGGVMPVPLCNTIPIIADTMPGSYNIGPDQIAARITKRTRAIIVAHIAGIPAPMDRIMALARRHNLPVIEDCSQAHGALYKNRLVGTFGTISVFSTMFGKHHATGGQGGVVFTRDRDLGWKIRRASDRGKPFGIEGATSNVVAALNCNSNDLNACIGRVQLKRLPRIVSARRALAAQLARACRNLRTITPEFGPPNTTPSYWFLFVRLDLARLKADKETILKALKAEGVPLGASYLVLFTRSTWYTKRAVFGKSGLPWTSPAYKGDPDRDYATPNVLATDACHFTMPLRENLTAASMREVAFAFRKVETAYACDRHG